jgi:hypothetical protein
MVTGNVPNLVGDTGIGKTEMFKEIAKKYDRDLVVLNLATQEPGDLIGLPRLDDNDKMTHWALPCWWPSNPKTIIFFDELNRARKDVLNAIMPLLLEKELHFEHKLNQDVWIASAMNPDDDDYDMVYGFSDRAIKSRLVFIQASLSFAEWTAYMKKNNLYNEILCNVIKNNPSKDLFQTKRKLIDFDIKPNPRSWTKYSNIIKYIKELENGIEFKSELVLIAQGMLGREVASEISSVLDNIFTSSENFTIPIDKPISQTNALDLAKEFSAWIQNNDVSKYSTRIVEWLTNLVTSHPQAFKNYIWNGDCKPLWTMNGFEKVVSIMTKE